MRKIEKFPLQIQMAIDFSVVHSIEITANVFVDYPRHFTVYKLGRGQRKCNTA